MLTNTNKKPMDYFVCVCGRSGSQPANLENVGRRPSLQSAQSDSNIRTGTKLTAGHMRAKNLKLSKMSVLFATLSHPGTPQIIRAEEPGPAPMSPVFRTGSEPLLSPKHTRPSLPGNTCRMHVDSV